MRKLLLTAISLLLLPSFSYAQSDSPQLTGTVAYRERIALPADAVIDVQLVDTSVADVAAQTVAEALINAEGRQVPVPFTLAYDPAKIVPGNRYSVRATIRSGDGMLMFSSTQAYPVLTHGAPSKVNLILHTVGHAHPAASAARKQAPSATSATAETTPKSVTSETASTVEPATSENAPAKPEPSTPASTAEQATPQPEASQPTPASASSNVAEQQRTPESEPTNTGAAASQPAITEAAPSPTPTSADSASHDSSAKAPPPVESSPKQSATNPAETAAQTPAPSPEQAAPATPPVTTSTATPEPESSSRDTQPVESQPAATAPDTPAPEAKAAEAPLPDSPSTTKQAELAAAARPESDEAAPDSIPEPPAANKALTPLADTQWKLVQLGGLPVVISPAQKPVTLAFSPEGRRIAGSAGCNSYLGTFNDDHGHLQLHPGTMTMISCADPAGGREKKFVAMLRDVDGYKISGDFLLLTSNGKTVAKFRNNQE